jgi:hypothetical protein
MSLEGRRLYRKLTGDLFDPDTDSDSDADKVGWYFYELIKLRKEKPVWI